MISMVTRLRTKETYIGTPAIEVVSVCEQSVDSATHQTTWSMSSKVVLEMIE